MSMSMRDKAEKLWCLLDDIDAASDMFKPSDNNPDSYKKFYNYVMGKVGKRFEYLKSDGYDLFTDEEWRAKKIDDVCKNESI